jgi:hypothetical protein
MMGAHLSGSDGSSGKPNIPLLLPSGAGILSAKVKAIHEISRLIWLEQRLNHQGQSDAVGSRHQEADVERIGQEAALWFAEGQAQQQALLTASKHGR